MYAVIVIRYRAELPEIEISTGSHRAYLAGLQEAGILLASGPMVPRRGGLLLVWVQEDDPAALDRIREADPYWQRGLVNYELIPWDPGIGREGLDRLAGHPR